MRILKFLKASLGIFLFGLFVTGALASDKGSPAEAEVMVTKAVAYLKANGPEKSAEEFTSGTLFKDRDLYIVYIEMSGKMLGNGSNPKLVGKDLSGLKDADGKLINQLFVDVAKTKGKGWSESYKFFNPVTKKMGTKAVYLERVGETIVGCGIYKD